MKNTAVLLITCPDRKGIVAAVAEFLYQHDANILHADQHQDAEREPVPHARRVGSRPGSPSTSPSSRGGSPRSPTGSRCAGGSKLSDQPLRVALFVSKYDHCLMDLLYRHQTGELPLRHPADRQQPPGRGEVGRLLRRAVPPHPGPGRRQGGGRAEATGPARGREDRPRGAGPVHADAVDGVRRAATRSGSSTSTTRSCRRSSGRSRTTGRSSAA